MSVYFVLVEGETEKHFLSSGLGVHAKVVIMNLWQNNAESYLRRFPASSKVFILCDTDTMKNHKELAMFRANIRLLVQQKLLKGIVCQNLNFEDELARSCCKTTNCQKLYAEFSAVSSSEFKTRFLKSSNLPERLKRLGFSVSSGWTGYLPPELSEFSKYRCTLVDLPTT